MGYQRRVHGDSILVRDTGIDQMIGLILVLSLAVFSNAGLLPWTDNDRNITEFTAQAPQGILWDGQCVADTASRLLRVELGKFDDNTPEACKDSCRELGYAYAGVEYGEECFCGNTPPLMSTIVGQEECDDPCTGDATQMCGGSWNMNVYQTGPCHVRDRHLAPVWSHLYKQPNVWRLGVHQNVRRTLFQLPLVSRGVHRIWRERSRIHYRILRMSRGRGYGAS